MSQLDALRSEFEAFREEVRTELRLLRTTAERRRAELLALTAETERAADEAEEYLRQFRAMAASWRAQAASHDVKPLLAALEARQSA